MMNTKKPGVAGVDSEKSSGKNVNVHEENT
jgi:hypothetical protein